MPSFLCFRQNAELAKMRQECSKLSKELTENAELLQQAKEQKAALEIRAVAYEGQIYQLQVSNATPSTSSSYFTIAVNMAVLRTPESMASLSSHGSGFICYLRKVA